MPHKQSDTPSLRDLLRWARLTQEDFARKVLIGRGYSTLHRWLKAPPGRLREWLTYTFVRFERDPARPDELHIVIHAPPTADLYSPSDDTEEETRRKRGSGSG